MTNKRLLLLARRSILLALATLTFAPGLHAQDYPNKVIKLIVPTAPGGATDVLGRLLAEKLPRLLGQSVIVENKPGAGTTVAANFVAKSPPDGYTLMMAISSLTTAPYYFPASAYDPLKDFEPVALLATVVHVLVVHPSLPVKNVKELIDYAKRNPGKLSFGTAGAGTSPHLEAELLQKMTGTKMVHVPYKGNGPALTDLIGGQIHWMFDARESVSPFIESGKLRALAVTSPERMPLMPELPTVAESGVPGFVAYPWAGVVAPAGTPRAVVDKLNRAIVEVSKEPAFQERVKSMGFTMAAGSSEQFGQFISQEASKWGQLIKTMSLSKE